VRACVRLCVLSWFTCLQRLAHRPCPVHRLSLWFPNRCVAKVPPHPPWAVEQRQGAAASPPVPNASVPNDVPNASVPMMSHMPLSQRCPICLCPNDVLNASVPNDVPNASVPTMSLMPLSLVTGTSWCRSCAASCFAQVLRATTWARHRCDTALLQVACTKCKAVHVWMPGGPSARAGLRKGSVCVVLCVWNLWGYISA